MKNYVMALLVSDGELRLFGGVGLEVGKGLWLLIPSPSETGKCCDSCRNFELKHICSKKG